MAGLEHVAVLCDFDGTVVPCQTIDRLYHRFAGPACQSYIERWRRGEISSQQELQGCFSTITASRAEMESFLDTIPIVPGFAPFLRFCQQRDYRLAIVSEGLRWSIEHILARHDIGPLSVFANEVRFEPHGLELSFPWHDPAYPMHGVSKATIVRRHQDEGCRVVYIGDGSTDEAAAKVADVVFARDALLAYCLCEGIEVIAFNGFDDVCAAWPLA
jgi:2-hydroxy-3-keto-5-methylthiopentenyl-1-phosphate phosphatase